MGRKKAPISALDVSEKQSTPLAQRLNALISDPNLLKDYLGCSVQAVNQYRLGTARPSLDNLCKIADFYSVSVDYLLGRTDVKPMDEDMKAAARYTGFSESTLEWLHSKKGAVLEIIDPLYRNGRFRMAVASISILQHELERIENSKCDGQQEISENDFHEFYKIESRLIDFHHRAIGEKYYLEWQQYRIARFLEAAISDILQSAPPSEHNKGEK